MAVRQEPSSPDPHEHVIDVQVQRVFVRRSPRYGRILGAGITVGLVIAAALTTFGAVSGDGVASLLCAGLLLAVLLRAGSCSLRSLISRCDERTGRCQ